MGLCEVRIRLWAIDSLKAKRGIAKSLLARMHNRFNVAVAEVRYLDSKEHLGLAVVSVANSRKVVDGLLSSVVTFLEDDLRFEVEDLALTYV
ncbi:MAG: DUF503 domain-containing protein [Candidatus Riflebacteria bacterium]|nr:DUF503 domain-containing protein [Candidatus Riflebacteria bacterium]